MIVPMVKYSFLVYHSDTDGFIKDLMNLGVLHIVSKGMLEDEKSHRLTTDIQETETVIKNFLRRNKKGSDLSEVMHDLPSVHEISGREHHLELLRHEADGLRAEIALLKPWGVFNRQQIAEIEKRSGLEMRFFKHSKRSFDKEWKDCPYLFLVNEIGDDLYFVVFSDDVSILPSVPLVLPSRGLEELKHALAVHEKEINELNKELNYYAARYQAQLAFRVNEAKDELSFHLAHLHCDEACEGKLRLLEGWCPENREGELKSYLDQHQIVYLTRQPEKDEAPPVLLKNNRFAKLFEPIGNMFSLPNYQELDLTLYFSPFFLLFFGFCLGDAGYGIILLSAATLLKLRMKGAATPYLTLMQLFGISTTVIGYFSGTLFGLEMAKVPAFDSMKNLFLSQDQLFNLALVIGFIQIVFGLAVNVYKTVLFQGWLHAMSKLGWIVLLISMGDLFVLERFSAITGITVWIGVVLIIGFGSPKDGWLKSIGFGLADLYNITGVLGDLLSYIRLFALGVSSAILGLVVNNIAMSAKDIPYVGIVLFLLMLIVGHGANLMLASLSAFVHPMRLTFVEFYKNAGFMGGGKSYSPLRRLIEKKE
jgi:V/A-type H+-transporting ATPase subunit I